MLKLTPLRRSVTPIGNSGNRLCCRQGWSIALLALLCGALSPTSGATCQMGCLTGFNTALGDDALINNTGFYNTAVGFDALFNNIMGAGNMASGDYALFSNTTGTNNTASGESALYRNTTGSNNTASGSFALFSNTTASGNTAIGDSALLNNTAGNGNTAAGELALLYNTTGNNNTANGLEALIENTTGDDNTATGVAALLGNTIGNNNTASGGNALLNNTTGNDNTANGARALYSNTTGNRNTGDGIAALAKNTTGSDNIALGDEAGRNLTIGDHNIDIGNQGVEAEANTIRIGRIGTQTATFIAGISGSTVPTGVAVIVDARGHLGTTTSSARYKEAIKPMDKASEVILALKPVTFRYKQEIGPDGIPQFGLVAEQVEKVNPALVARDDQGKPYTVRYEAVNAMLLNEFLKEHREVQEQKATIVEFKKEIANLTATVKEQAAQIQKVSAQVELSKPTPRTVLNNNQ